MGAGQQPGHLITKPWCREPHVCAGTSEGSTLRHRLPVAARFFMFQGVIFAAIRPVRLFLLGMAALFLLAGQAVCAPRNAGWFTRTWRTDDGVANHSIVIGA